MKAIEIYQELINKKYNQWDIIDILETEYHNQNFNSELFEDYPFFGNIAKSEINYGTEGAEAFQNVINYIENIDFEFNQTTTKGY
ncbi:hypothetical protein ACTQXJ_07460 [Collinsella sp. LCP19S3_C6]|uniref:hypothetical protein n=1 Tax=Collinsella sp. LCP19S3_C6 TaxID=3438759 RepID=UPI003F914243